MGAPRRGTAAASPQALLAHSEAKELPNEATSFTASPPLLRAISLESGAKPHSEEVSSSPCEREPSHRLQSAEGLGCCSPAPSAPDEKARPAAPSPPSPVSDAVGRPHPAPAHNSAAYLSEPRPPPRWPPRAGVRTREPGGAPYCATEARGGLGSRGRACGGSGALGAGGRAWVARVSVGRTAESYTRTAPTVRAPRGTAHSARAAGRSRPAGPGGPASRALPRAAHLSRRSPAVSHRLGAGERERVSSPPPHLARPSGVGVGVPPRPQVYVGGAQPHAASRCFLQWLLVGLEGRWAMTLTACREPW